VLRLRSPFGASRATTKPPPSLSSSAASSAAPGDSGTSVEAHAGRSRRSARISCWTAAPCWCTATRRPCSTPSGWPAPAASA
jgi:hypothetical protein